MSRINPSNSRAQKLKKLYQISRELINEYGYAYFLRVAFEELFTQKGKLFSPDTIPQDIEDGFILDYGEPFINDELSPGTDYVYDFMGYNYYGYGEAAQIIGATSSAGEVTGVVKTTLQTKVPNRLRV